MWIGTLALFTDAFQANRFVAHRTAETCASNPDRSTLCEQQPRGFEWMLEDAKRPLVGPGSTINADTVCQQFGRTVCGDILVVAGARNHRYLQLWLVPA